MSRLERTPIELISHDPHEHNNGRNACTLPSRQLACDSSAGLGTSGDIDTSRLLLARSNARTGSAVINDDRLGRFEHFRAGADETFVVRIARVIHSPPMRSPKGTCMHPGFVMIALKPTE